MPRICRTFILAFFTCFFHLLSPLAFSTRFFTHFFHSLFSLTIFTRFFYSLFSLNTRFFHSILAFSIRYSLLSLDARYSYSILDTHRKAHSDLTYSIIDLLPVIIGFSSLGSQLMPEQREGQ